MRDNVQRMIAAATLLSLQIATACSSSPGGHSAKQVVPAVQASSGADLQAAMNKLEASIHNPAGPFHASFKKSTSDGFLYECEAEISPKGITGQQTNSNPATKVGDDIFPANTRTRALNGTPYGSPDWQTAYGGISMAYLNGHIGDAQPGVKYVHDEETGGYAARRYDFDLTGVDADVKKAMELGNSLGMRQTKDYNVKGSAWIANEDGRLVKFSFDNIYTFTDGKRQSTHYEGAIAKK